MKLAINLFTMFPWILYVIEIYYYRIGVIETGRYNKDKYFKHLNKNLFSSINIKELVLFFIFILFMLYKKKKNIVWLVLAIVIVATILILYDYIKWRNIIYF